MELLKLLYFLTLLSLAIVATPAKLDNYWKSKLPNTPMPKAIRDLLYKGNGGVDMAKDVYRPVYYASEDELQDNNPFTAFFFLEKDLHTSTSKNLQFVKSANTATFLPRQVADSIPFQLKYLPEILNKFSVKTESAEAKLMKAAISECEEPGIKGEEKYCATSLESMIDFAASKLGKNIQAVSTEAKNDAKTRKYSILDVTKLNHEDQNIVACHKQHYVYAVFYCHITKRTEAYVVSMRATDGAKAKVVAVCHKDTAEWSPKSMALQVLKVKPGTVPICHFLPEEHIIWVPK